MGKLALSLATVALLLASTVQAAKTMALLPGDPAKGKKLVETKCNGCHAQMMGGDPAKIFTRPNHKVKSVEGLMGQVAMCNQQLDTRLSKDDLDNIIIYLNQAYYRF